MTWMARQGKKREKKWLYSKVRVFIIKGINLIKEIFAYEDE